MTINVLCMKFSDNCSTRSCRVRYYPMYYSYNCTAQISTNTNVNENTALHLFVAHSNKQSRNCEDVDVELVNGKMNMQIKQAM